MKTNMKTIYRTLCVLLSVLLGASCSDDNVSDLQLSGDCSIETLILNDTYTGQVDLSKRSVKVKVPADYTDKTKMRITQLAISDGASASMRQGDIVDFTDPKVMHITNGDLFLDWTVSVRNDEARILSFIINDTYKASINEAEHTITASLPADVDVTKIVPTITYSEDAVIFPLDGTPTDFSEPVEYTVTDNTATATYTVTITTVSAPDVIFLGSAGASTMDELQPEEKEACKWMLSNVENSLFVSWDDMKAGNADLSKCKVIWWHWQHQPSETLSDFESGATSSAMAAKNTLVDYYKRGGAFIFSRAAVNMAASLGAVRDQRCANNCWGASDDGGEILGASWDFPVADQNDWMWKGIIGGTSPLRTLDAGYQISNCVSQWGMWGDYTDHARWKELTGCLIHAHGWDNAVTIWEAPAADGTFGQGGIICFGSGCYDWYSPNPYVENYHKNVGIMTLNAINYLMGK